jgi:hypothetical protein
VASRLVRATGLLISGLIALTVIAGSPRAGQDQPLNLRYAVYWGGVRIATLTLHHQVESNHYRSRVDLETVGLLEHLAPYRSSVLATGHLNAGEGLAPVTFRSTSQAGDKDRQSVVRFDPQSGDVVNLKNTRRGKPRTSDVPAALQAGVIDPLTAFFELRDYVATAATGKPFTAAVFDGWRRFDLMAKVIGHDRVRVVGRDQPVIRVWLTLTFVAGSDLDDAEAAAAGDNRFEFELVLSDDKRLLPLQLRTRDSMITGVIELLQDCSGEAGCQLAAR